MPSTRNPSCEAGAPILDEAAKRGFTDRLKETIGDRTRISFAKRCGISDSLLGAYVRGEKLPGLENLVAMAQVGGISLDWLATGRTPKNPEVSGGHVLGRSDGPLHLETLMQAVQVLQEWQIENGRFLSTDKFLRAAELLVELAGDKPEQVKQHAPQVLRLAA